MSQWAVITPARVPGRADCGWGPFSDWTEAQQFADITSGRLLRLDSPLLMLMSDLADARATAEREHELVERALAGSSP